MTPVRTRVRRSIETAAHDAADAPTVRRTRVGAADDRYEREADAVAAEVVGRLASDPAAAGASMSTSSAGPAVRRSPAEAVGPEGGEVDADVETALQRSRGGGTPLSGGLRRTMERAFGDGTDLGGVRVHSGTESADLNARLGASAFTLGSDVYLGAGAPSMATGAGKQLLAHELTHTLQAGNSGTRR